MKLLADENTHGHITRWLRSNGHDVLWATESLSGQPDPALLDIAAQQQRLIFTADLDFGELIYQQQLNSHGVILVRLEHLTVQDRIMRLQALWPVVEANSAGKFIVITHSKIRVRNLLNPWMRDPN